MKKEFLSELAEEYNEKSDTELVDVISDLGANRTETAQVLLELRLKKSLQFLTEVTQKNNSEMEIYNKKLTRLTFWLLILTLIMTVATLMNIILLFR